MNFNILDYIPFGRENAISRQRLMQLTGLPDRENRELIQKARRDTPIINIQRGEGYFRPLVEERDLVEKWLKQEESRAKSVFWSSRGAKKFLNEVK